MLLSDFNALTRITETGSQTPSQLAFALTLDSSSITELADRLERAGLITRERVPTDRRAVALKPTAAGKRKMTRAHKDLNVALAKAVEDMSDADVAVVARFLETLQVTLTTVTEGISAP